MSPPVWAEDGGGTAGGDADFLSALADWLESSARTLDVPGSYADIEDAAVCLRRALRGVGPGREGGDG